MGIFSHLFDSKRDLSGLPPDVIKALDGNPSLIGVFVNEATALRVSAVWYCAGLLADTIGALPLHMYRKIERGKERASTHPLDRLLNLKANPWMTAMTMRQAVMLHLALWRNAFIQIERSGAGQIIGLWPLLPDRTKPKTVAGRLLYETRLPDGTPKEFLAEQICHIRGMTLNGLEGINIIEQARDTLSLLLTQQEYGSRFFKNGANPGGVVTTDAELTPEQRKQMAEMIEEQVKGLEKAHRLLVLSNSAKFTPIGIEPQKAQLLESRRFQIEEVGRWFRIPGYKLGLTEKGMSYASVEQQQIAFVQEAILPWLVQIEQSIAAFALTEEESRTYYCRHVVEGLLRGDTKSRYEAYHYAIMDGWLNRDEVRELEDRNPMPDGQGQIYLTPANMEPAPDPGDGDGEGSQRTAPRRVEHRDKEAAKIGRRRQRIIQTFRRLIADAMARIVRREESDIIRKARELLGKRDAGAAQFDRWLDDWYIQHPQFIERHLWPVLLAFAESMQADAADEAGAVAGMTPEMERFAKEYLEKYTAYHIGSSKGQIRQVLQRALEEGEDPVEALQERFDEWTETRPAKVGDYHSVKAGNFFVKMAFVLAGVTHIRWNAAGDTCPSCQRLHGRSIGIQQVFIQAGEEHDQGEGSSPLKLTTDVSHPPAHRGCDCFITKG